MPEDPADDRGILDQRNEPQTATAPRTRQHINPEGPARDRGPTPPTPVAAVRAVTVGISRFAADAAWLGTASVDAVRAARVARPDDQRRVEAEPLAARLTAAGRTRLRPRRRRPNPSRTRTATGAQCGPPVDRRRHEFRKHRRVSGDRGSFLAEANATAARTAGILPSRRRQKPPRIAACPRNPQCASEKKRARSRRDRVFITA